MSKAIFLEARELISDPEHVVIHPRNFAETTNGLAVDTDCPTAVRFCLTGAVIKAARANNKRYSSSMSHTLSQAKDLSPKRRWLWFWARPFDIDHDATAKNIPWMQEILTKAAELSLD